MKTLVLSSLLLTMVSLSPVIGQEIQENLDSKTLRKMQKEEKRLKKEEELAVMKEYITHLVNSRRFVLEAHNLGGRSGAQVPVNSTLNFLAVDSSKAVLQIGSVSGLAGYNGVGGVTDECTVGKYEIRYGKSNISVTIYLHGMLSSYTIFLTANYGTQSSARVSGLSGGILTYFGKLVSLSESRVFKGRQTY